MFVFRRNGVCPAPKFQRLVDIPYSFNLFHTLSELDHRSSGPHSSKSLDRFGEAKPQSFLKALNYVQIFGSQQLYGHGMSWTYGQDNRNKQLYQWLPIWLKFVIRMVNATSDENLFAQAKRKKKKKKVRQTAAVQLHMLPQYRLSFSLLLVQERPLEME